ncbi:MAG: ISKra4 family transposase, partial [Symploca sp. SIO3E6]|nr:ISKra4 family transposase [Caldora sp. SIO3E6]
RISPYLEQCCVRASANVSYENAARDIEYYTGIKISSRTQQRIVHRHEFPPVECEEKISEMSVDGGKVRLRTETKGEPCIWKDYKAVCLDKVARNAWFGENEELVNWVNKQPLSEPISCLGDGHPGIWNIVKQIESPGEKREILDWYHLVENLHKVGGSMKRLKEAESLLWSGKVEETIKLISVVKRKQAINFCNYLETHRHRIINYSYYQEEDICSIASGAVESTVKQIDRRLKISGAQWRVENVPQVLRHRCAYLNNNM